MAMSNFDLSELLPFYLDETDEQIGALNENLLRLEADPNDASALQETFRVVHSLKGSSSVMGFEDVKRLTHHLETLFDRLRTGAGSLDRSALDLCFQCLDELRDYHRQLRQEGQGLVDLGASTEAVLSLLETDRTVDASDEAPAVPANDVKTPDDREADEEPDAHEPAEDDRSDDSRGMAITIRFEQSLRWRDMKARLILNRLSSRVQVRGSDPPSSRLEEVEHRADFVVWVESEADRDALRDLANVDGVASLRFDDEPALQTEPSSDSRVDGSGGTGGSSTSAPAPKPTLVDEPPVPLRSTATRKQKPLSKETEASPPSQAETTETVEAPHVAEAPKRTSKIGETIRVDVDRLDHLMNLAGELVISRAQFSRLTSGIGALFRTSDARSLSFDAEERLAGLEAGIEAILRRFDDVNGDAAMIDRWRSQTRRLGEDLAGLRDELDRLREGREHLSGMTEALDQLGRVCDGIQKGVLETRMVPIGPLFERFRRVLRDLSVGSSKEVALDIRGESTELDKRMVDELSDPLIHLIRNAVDHGLEDAEERQGLGKPRTGKVTLCAAHRGNRVLITVADDGRGLNVDRIREKVVSNGLLTASQAEALDPTEVIPYIFHPGLSTASTVTEISGRGVGMDIVKDRIEQLSGSVSVRSEAGQGTRFEIRLPLTLAIMTCLLVRVHDEIYAIPLGEIREIVEVPPEQWIDLRGGRAVEVRGRVIALCTLDDVFRWGGGPHPAGSGEGSGPRPVVVLQGGHDGVGLAVDALIGIQEVVLKSLERNYRAVRGLSGASVLGDGRIALILDVDALIEMATRDRVAPAAHATFGGHH